MSPDPGKEYTVKCSLKRAVPDLHHLKDIREAVLRTNQCTYLATELVNLYVRDRIENHDATGLEKVFDRNWLIKAYYVISEVEGSKATLPAELVNVYERYMKGTFKKPTRSGLTQALLYECTNLSAVGSTNIWMHFQKRVLSYVRTHHSMDEESYQLLSPEERRARKLALMQVAHDICKSPGEEFKSPKCYHAWITDQRDFLRIDEAVGIWGNKPLLYHLKKQPQNFLRTMYTMSMTNHKAGRKAFALFPLRRSHVPGHVRFDQKVVNDVLRLGFSFSTGGGKREEASLSQRKAEIMSNVLDLRSAKVHRKQHFAYSFTTDGVSIHLNMEKPGSNKKRQRNETLNALPKRGIHSIDALKHVTRKEEVHIIGIDPGKRELVVAVDHDDSKCKPVVRYTSDQRKRDMRTRQYADEMNRSKPFPVFAAEEDLSKYNSKAPTLTEFAAFGAERRRILRECKELEFYNDLCHRNRRRKSAIKSQKSMSHIVNRLKQMHGKDDTRTPILAYGAWGLIAGRPNSAANKGNPPVIGAGLMKHLALHFVVALTPEHYTSRICVECGGLCSAHPTLKTKKNKEIRGLRVCQHEGCGLLQNRDKTGATNIGRQFARLIEGKDPLRVMNEEEAEFNVLNLCVECYE